MFVGRESMVFFGSAYILQQVRNYLLSTPIFWILLTECIVALPCTQMNWTHINIQYRYICPQIILNKKKPIGKPNSHINFNALELLLTHPHSHKYRISIYERVYGHVCIKQTHAVNSIEFHYSSESRPAVSGTPHRRTKLYASIRLGRQPIFCCSESYRLLNVCTANINKQLSLTEMKQNIDHNNHCKHNYCI